jgi:hypothetical protein
MTFIQDDPFTLVQSRFLKKFSDGTIHSDKREREREISIDYKRVTPRGRRGKDQL